MSKKESIKEVASVETEQPKTSVINPCPVPTTFQVATVSDNNTGQEMVMLVISSPTGQSVYFLDPETSKVIGEALYRLGEKTKASSLILPPAGLVVPN